MDPGIVSPMSDTQNPAEEGEDFAPGNYFSTLPTWKKLLIGGAVLMLIAAGVIMFLEDPKPEPVGGTLSAQATGDTASPGLNATWSEAFFKFGFSFFVGFAIGYASRAFLKFLFFLVGGMAIVLFALNYYGFVTVEWEKMETAFNSLGSSIQGQIGEFRSFITGSLPNAGLAGLGLFAGFKKNG